MLSRLLKYDLKWIYKLLIIFYILTIIFSILGRTLLSIENSLIFNIVGQVCLASAIALMINILINNLMRVWARFVKNIYKDESYLTHTLPIEKKTIYLAKVLSAIITMFSSVVVIVICIAICFYSNENIQNLKNILEIVASTYDSTIISLLLIIFLVFFVEMIFTLLSGYLGIILGHKSNNNKMTKSIIYGFLIYALAQIITLSIIFIIGMFNPNVMNLYNTVENINIDTMKSIMCSGIVIYIIYILIYYTVGKRQFEKGVNIE